MRKIVIAVLLAVFACGGVRASDRGHVRMALQNMPGFSVDVVIVDESGWTTEYATASAVEIQLRRWGVPVVSREQAKTEIPGFPVLRIAFCGSPIQDGAVRVYWGYAEIDQQVVQPTSQGFQEVRATVWREDGGPFICTEVEEPRAMIAKLIDVFANDYLAANPRQSEKAALVELADPPATNQKSKEKEEE